jgi:hypothetical protein
VNRTLGSFGKHEVIASSKIKPARTVPIRKLRSL